MLNVSGIKLPLHATEQDALALAHKKAGVPPSMVVSAGVNKLSVDARHGKAQLVYSVLLTLADGVDETQFASKPGVSVKKRTELVLAKGVQKAMRPVVVGAGPAGLFAALLLAQNGAKPLLLERGPQIEQRAKLVDEFYATGNLCEDANIQFGEGGAGTFSDGKLVTRIGDARCDWVTKTLLRHGAPAEIALRAKPHVGTDLLRGVISSIRKEIEALGGEVLFNTKVTGFYTKNGSICGLATTAGDFPAEAVVLAVGHSARDVFEFLPKHGVELICKPFSVGFRAEHLQTAVNSALYHEAAGHPALPQGEYQLSAHPGRRGVYTFCMCPGGQVVAAASEKGHLCTNGMSYHARDGKNANAAVVVGVDGADFGQDPAKAIAFQRSLEKAAFDRHGEYIAPAENIQSFLRKEGRLSITDVKPTYSRGVKAADLGSLLPDHLAQALRAGLVRFGQLQPGYCAPEAILTGLETRTSSPVRILRQDNTECKALAGLYPCGEGAGYAGGIMSAAVDGLRVAESLLARYDFE